MTSETGTGTLATPSEPASPALREVADAFWERYMATHPTFATILGDRRFDDRLEDLSPAGRVAEIADLNGTLEAAQAIDPAGLGPRDRVTRSMLIGEVRGQLAALESRVDEWSVNPLDGPQVWLVDLVDYQPIESPHDGAMLVARWREVGRHIDQVIDGLRRGLGSGRVASVVPLERVIDEVRGLLATPVDDWRLARPAGEPHPDWAPGEAERFAAALRAAVAEVAVPAFERYLEALTAEILPAARPSDRPGLLHVPGGDEAYRLLIRTHTTLDLDPAAVHELGLEEIDRLDEAFADLGARVLHVHGLEATLQALREDPALRFATADEVFETARATLARAEAAVPAWFGRTPVAPCEVVPIPAESEAHQTIAYYAWPALDGSRPGRYHINLHEPTTRPRYEAEALAFHEAVPGHHLQMAIAQELGDLPAFQRALGSNAFCEGWALYTERLADEMGLYSTELDRFGILSFDAWRACRLVVDTGLHALGWTRDAAIAFMAAHTALGINNIENEVDRYIAWPAQALGYKVGQLEILRLRAEAERTLGPAFDIRAFHDAVLGSGGVSLATLGEIVGDWIAAGGSRPAG